MLGKEVRDKVIRRNDVKKARKAEIKENKQSKLRELQRKVRDIRSEMVEKTKTMKELMNKQLQSLIMWKKKKEDKKMPTNKKDLLQRWSKIKDRPSPHVSPFNSETEEMIGEDYDAGAAVEKGDEDADSDDEEMVYHRRRHQRHTLVFDPVESEDKQSGNASEEEEWEDSSD